MESSVSTNDQLLCELRDTQDLEARWRLFEKLWRQCEKIVDRKLNRLAGFTPEGTDSKYFIEEVKQLVSWKLWKSARLYRGSFFDAFLTSIVKSCSRDLQKKIGRLGRRVVGVAKMRELVQGLRRRYEEQEEEETEDQLLSQLAYRSIHYVVPYGFDPSKLVENRETKRIVTLALALYAQKNSKKNRNSVKAVMWRFRKGLTNKEIAARFLVAERTIERWINDHNLPGIETTLAERFGVTRLADIL